MYKKITLLYSQMKLLMIFVPKQSEDYDEVSRHLEMNADYYLL